MPQSNHSSNLGNNFRWRHFGILMILGVCTFHKIVNEDILSFTTTMLDKTESKDVLGDLKMRATNARKEVEKFLDEDYGTFKDDVFNKDTIMNAFTSPSKVSVDRLQRRILIKILEAQLLSSDEVDFNWVIAGHSAAAGHGNLFNQTYAYILEETARPVFEALGITFYGKNYAEGNTKSGPENAFCMSAHYGVELDILSWDFGMTDGSMAEDLYHIWTQRAGIHPTSPILISYGSTSAPVVDHNLENAGMSAFRATFIGSTVGTEKRKSFAATFFPNSDDSKVDVSELPRGVKYYVCDGRIESGEPCGEIKNKFHTDHVCPKVKGQFSWHNGFKDHLLKGRVSAFFLIENVFEALNKLDSIPSVSSENESSSTKEEEEKEDANVVSPSISEEYLNYLYSLEARDKKSFMSSDVPKFPFFEGDLEEHHDAFLRANHVCRISYLPSYTRYSGILTENPQEDIKYLFAGKTTYQDEGVPIEALPPPNPGKHSEPLLIYNYDEHGHDCDDARIDVKNFFGIRNVDQWVTTILPNDSENSAFTLHNDDAEARLGILTLCIRNFASTSRPIDYQKFDQMFNTTETTIKVNDVPVTNHTKIGNTNAYCHVLKNEKGYTFPSSDEHGPGRYKLQFKVPKKGGSLYLSSFIVF